MLKATLLTAASAELGGAFSVERWAYAGRMTLLGMVMIFAVLGLLWGILAIFKLIMVGGTPKPEKKKSAIAEVVEESATVAEEPEAADDGELVAVIAAAIAAYRASEGMDAADASSFRVVSFRRTANGRAWNTNR